MNIDHGTRAPCKAPVGFGQLVAHPRLPAHDPADAVRVAQVAGQ
jgi:hypothetical protein